MLEDVFEARKIDGVSGNEIDMLIVVDIVRYMYHVEQKII